MYPPVDLCLGIVRPESETVQTALTWRYALFSSLEEGCPWRVSRLRLKWMYWDWEYKNSLSICGKQRNEFSPGLILDPGVQNVCHFRLETSLKYPCVLSLFRLFATPWIVAGKAPLSMGFSRQEYWSGLPCPPPRDLSDSGIELVSLMSPALAGGFFTTCATWEAHLDISKCPLCVTGEEAQNCPWLRTTTLDFPISISFKLFRLTRTLTESSL